MENRKRKKGQGVPIKRLNTIMLIIALIIAACMIIVMYFSSVTYKETHEITQNLSKWRTSAYDLQVGSDFLTDRIRCFVATGNKVYLDDYFEEANVTKRRDNALKNLESHRTYTAALSDLRKAMEESTQLMDAEYTAAKLTVLAHGQDLSEYPEEIQEAEVSDSDMSLSDEKKKEKATDLVFGEDYRKAKNQISDYMQKCMDSLSEDMGADQLKMSAKLETQLIIEDILTVMMIIVIILIVVLNSRLVVRPLEYTIELIREDKDLPMQGATEVRFLAKTYNRLRHTSINTEDQPHYEEMHDAETDLYNADGYEFLMKNIDCETSALLYIEDEKYDDVIEKHGQEVADRMTVLAAKQLRKAFRSHDYVCRLDNGLLAVILVNAAPAMTDLIKDKIKDVNSKLKFKDETLPPINLHMGGAFGGDGEDADELQEHAKQALEGLNEKHYGALFYHELMGFVWIR